MSEFRRMLMSNTLEQESTQTDPSLIFYAPLTQDDLTEHITGNSFTITGDGQMTWDESNQIWHFVTPTTTYKCIMTIEFPWEDKLANGFTCIVDGMRISGPSIANNKCRPFLMGDGTTSSEKFPEWTLCPGSTDRWGYSMGTFIVYRTTTNNTKAWKYNGTVFWNQTQSWQKKDFSYPHSNYMSIGCSGHPNYRQAHFGLKNIRIYNRILSTEEIAYKINNNVL